jgi:histone chaperone ASF1
MLQCLTPHYFCLTNAIHIHCFQVVLDNPTQFTNPLQFEITFECLQDLDDDLEWKILYVGSAESSEKDQCLDEILVGPVPVGVNKFVLQADAPDVALLGEENVLGVTVVLITCSYKDQEFVRIGYYVNNEYPCESEDAILPSPLPLEQVIRTTLADKPRVTRFNIQWNSHLNEVSDSSPLDMELMMSPPSKDIFGGSTENHSRLVSPSDDMEL